MNLNKQQETELLQVYNAYWENYIKGDVQSVHTLLDDDYTQIGSAEGEVFLNKKDAVRFIYDTIDQVAGKLDMRNRRTRVDQQEKMVLLIEQCDLYALAGDDWIFYSKFRASTIMHVTSNGWKIVHQHSSFPDIQAQEGENIAIEKIAAENIQLREAVKRRTAELEHQNRELEIEASLERVRTVAMSMSKTDDVLSICKVMFNELQSLGFSDLRNAIINFWDDENDSLLDYDYSDFSGQHTARIPYNTHPTFEKFQQRIRSATDAFVELIVREDELESWKERRRTSGEYEDPRLENIAALYYYFYSIGVGAIGISTLSSLTEDKLRLLKRFRNVFDLAYRRYIDIHQAEAQAREAQIQLALERVRAKTMAMQNSGELAEVASLLFHQVKGLGIDVYAAGFTIWNEESENLVSWACNADGSMNPPFPMPYKENDWHFQQYQSWKNGEDFILKDLSDEAMMSYFQYLRSFPLLDEAFKISIAAGHPMPERQVHNAINFSQGNLLFITYVPVPEAHDIFKRFAKVFEQTYTRFLDLQKAEAQAREARIETALEKIRGRSLAMHKSDELQEVVNTVFERLQALDVEMDSANIAIFEEGSRDFEYWVASDFQNRAASFHMPYTELLLTKDLIAARESGADYSAKSYSLEEKNEWFNYAFSKTDFKFLPAERKQFILGASAITVSIAFSKYTGVQVIRYSTKLLSEGETEIVKRFSRVFEQAYVRFLDLQKAEAQAKEAQIEAALERVRSRSMAMHKSEELANLSLELVKQVQTLGVNTWFCAFNIYDDDSQGSMEWGSNGQGTFPKYRTPREGIFLRYYQAGQKNEALFINKIGEDECPAHYEYLCTLPGVGEQLLKMKAGGIPFPTSQIDHVAFFKYGYIIFITYEPVPESHDIFKRFAKVFEQTYTRFLDLQKAEAQAREAKIEAALERVRSRTMGMQKSVELKEVIKIVFQQLRQLEIKLDHAGFVVDYTPGGDWHFWIADEQEIPSTITHPYFESVWADQFNKAKETGADLFATNLNFEEKNKFYSTLLSYVTDLPQESKDFYLNCPGLAISTVLFDNVSLYIENFAGIPYTGDENDVMMRFGKVFQQTYTRFNDLQKAEGQAREAQIELGLERVRSSAMAMHSTSGFLDVTKVLREQVAMLGEKELESIIIHIYNEEADSFEAWYSYRNPEDVSGKIIDGRNKVSWSKTARALSDKHHYYSAEDDYTIVANRGMLTEWYQCLYEAIPEVVDLDEKGNIIVPDILYYNYSKFKGGALLLITNSEASDNSKRLLKRSAEVFNLAYTRFLDLQKAEAQAREAQIEAALERVRSRTLAMQKSDELPEAAAVLFQQLINLGIEPHRLYICIIKQDSGEAEFWLTDEDGTRVSMPYTINLNENTAFRTLFTRWKEQSKSSLIDLQGQQLDEYLQYLTSLDVPLRGGLSQKRRLQYIAYFNRGFIGMASPDEQPVETIKLLERFAAVFNLTFTRFNDLKIAEAQALQSEKDLLKIIAARKKAEEALIDLRAAQKQLVQSEKMASLGELTAGIAHEIQNPLNFVNNFSDVSKDMLYEMNEALSKGDMHEVSSLATDIIKNLEKINHHGKRADAIVKGMLQHSRVSNNRKELTNINALTDEYLRLAYHGFRAKDKSFNATLKTAYDESIGNINIVPQDISRAILNIINNAFYAVDENKKRSPGNYNPTVSVNTKRIGAVVEIRITDNGNGVPQNILEKIFQPFFTTKPTGQGTGLGLSLAYDIIKAHDGELKVKTKEGEGSEFIIQLPAL